MNQHVAPDTTARPDRAMPLAKALTHALIIASILHATTRVATAPGVALLLGVLSPGAYLPFALSTSAAMHGIRSAALIILAGTLVLAYPATTNDLATHLVPVGAGLLAGTGLRNAIKEATGEPS